MVNSHRTLCLALALGLSFALGLEPQRAVAQRRPFEKVPGKLDMRLKLPHPVMRSGAPFALQLDFESTFPDVIEGPLELTFYDEGLLQLKFLTTPVVIAADSSTAYSIQLPSLTCIRTPTEFQVSVVLQSARKTFDLGKHDLLIALRGTRQFVIAAPGLNEVDVGQLVRSLSLDEFRPRKLNRQNFATYSAELDPHRILGDPMGLYPYDVVVLVGQHFSALSPRQLETVATWTESGGGLVVVPSGVLTDAHCRFLARLTGLDLGSFQTDALGRLSPLGPGDPHQLVSGNYGFGRTLILRSLPSLPAKDAAAPGKGRDADGAKWIRAVGPFVERPLRPGRLDPEERHLADARPAAAKTVGAGDNRADAEDARPHRHPLLTLRGRRRPRDATAGCRERAPRHAVSGGRPRRAVRHRDWIAGVVPGRCCAG